MRDNGTLTAAAGTAAALSGDAVRLLLVEDETLLRRREAPPVVTLELADLVLDRTRRRVERGGTPVELTPKEFALLDAGGSSAVHPECDNRVAAAAAGGRS